MRTASKTIHVIAPSLGPRFSGINASMIAVLPELQKRIGIAAMGFQVPGSIAQIGVWQFVRDCWRGPWRIWHARRNLDMLAGVLLRDVLRFKLLLVFTSAAQRRHSWITRFCLGRMDGIIATSAAAASFIDREAVVVPHGVNTEVFSPPADRAACWTARRLSGRFGIGVFGRLRPQKGTEEFVDAMIRVLPERPEWTAVLIGDTTPEFQAFERRLRTRIAAAGLDGRFHFTGFIERFADIPDWYRSLSVVVCASRTEGFGLTCLEAMASGCPVVATRAGAWPELIADGVDGHLVPPHDAAALADAIARITADPARARDMGERARRKACEHHQIRNEADGIYSVYRTILATRGIGDVG